MTMKKNPTDPAVHNVDAPVDLSAPPMTPADQALASATSMAIQAELEGIERVQLPKAAPGAQRVTVVLQGGRTVLLAPDVDFRTTADARKLAALDTETAETRLVEFIDAVTALDSELGAHVEAAILSVHTEARRLTSTKIVDPLTGLVLTAELAERAEAAELAAVKRAEKLGKPAPDLTQVNQRARERLLRGAQAAERSAIYWTLNQGLVSAAEMLRDVLQTGKVARMRARAERRPLTADERAMVSRAEAAKRALQAMPTPVSTPRS